MIFKELQKEENDTLNINNISMEEWEKYYNNIWNTNNVTEKRTISNTFDEPETEEISMEELEQAIEKTRNRKSSGLDNIPMNFINMEDKS